MALLLIAFLIHIVDRSSEHVNEIKQTKVVEPTRLAPAIDTDDDLGTVLFKNGSRGPGCIVADCKITDAILKKVMHHENLHEITLKRCEFTHQDLQVLSAFPLEIFRVEDGHIDANCLRVISGMHHLKLLELLNCDVDSAAFVHLAHLKITWLQLRCSQNLKNKGEFTAADLEALTNSNSLRYLELERTKFSPGAFHGLAKCSAFGLNVSRCNLSDDDISDIAQMPKLVYLDFVENPKITCTGFKTLLKSKTFRVGASDFASVNSCEFTAAEKHKLDPRFYSIRDALW